MSNAALELQARKQARAEAEERLRASFAIFDKDNSGFLSADEVLNILTRVLPGAPPMSESDAKDFIHDFDENGDGERRM